MSILLTIIIPIYNVEDYILECLESVVPQLTDEVEIICINDGTKDNSLIIANKFIDLQSLAVKDRVVIVSQENKGLSEARNTGIKLSKGEYIAFLDSDDRLNDCFVQDIIAIIKQKKPDLIDFNLSTSTNKTMYIYGNSSHLDLKSLFKSGKWFACSRVYSRGLIGNDLFINGIYYEDIGFVPKKYLKANKIEYLNKSLYWYRIRQNSITTAISDDAYNKSLYSFKKLIENYQELYKVEHKKIYYTFSFFIFFTMLVYVCNKKSKIEGKKLMLKYKYLLKDKNQLDLSYLSHRTIFFLYFPKVYLFLFDFYLKLRKVKYFQ